MLRATFITATSLEAKVSWVRSDVRIVRSELAKLFHGVEQSGHDPRQFWETLADGLSRRVVRPAEVDAALGGKVKERRGLVRAIYKGVARFQPDFERLEAADITSGTIQSHDLDGWFERGIAAGEIEACAWLVWLCTLDNQSELARILEKHMELSDYFTDDGDEPGDLLAAGCQAASGELAAEPVTLSVGAQASLPSGGAGSPVPPPAAEPTEDTALDRSEDVADILELAVQSLDRDGLMVLSDRILAHVAELDRKAAEQEQHRLEEEARRAEEIRQREVAMSRLDSLRHEIEAHDRTAQADTQLSFELQGVIEREPGMAVGDLVAALDSLEDIFLAAQSIQAKKALLTTLPIQEWDPVTQDIRVAFGVLVADRQAFQSQWLANGSYHQTQALASAAPDGATGDARADAIAPSASQATEPDEVDVDQPTEFKGLTVPIGLVDRQPTMEKADIASPIASQPPPSSDEVPEPGAETVAINLAAQAIPEPPAERPADAVQPAQETASTASPTAEAIALSDDSLLTPTTAPTARSVPGTDSPAAQDQARVGAGIHEDLNSHPAELAIEPTPTDAATASGELDELSMASDERRPLDLVGSSFTTTQALDSGQLNMRLCTLIQQEQLGLAYHLTRTSEALGMPGAVPATVLRAWVMSTQARRAFSPSNLDIAGAIEAAIETPDSESRELAARAAMFAALVRPAIVASDTSANDRLGQLEMRGLEVLAPLRQACVEIDHRVRLSLADLAASASKPGRDRRAEAEADLREWLNLTQRGKAVHQTASKILQDIAREGGEFGRAFKAALTQQPNAEAAMEDLVRAYSEDDALPTLISRKEQDAKRPKRDKLIGMAQNQAVSRLRDGVEVARRWLVAVQTHDDSPQDEHQASTINRLRKGLQEVKVRLMTSPLADTLAASIVDIMLKETMRLLQGEVADREEEPAPDLVAHLRIPASVRLEGPQKEYEVLLSGSGVAATDEIAFHERLAEGAFDDAFQLLNALRRHPAIDREPLEELRLRLDEECAEGSKRMLQAISQRRRDLATLASIDLETAADIRAWIDLLDNAEVAINACRKRTEGVPWLPVLDGMHGRGLPRDFPEFRRQLSELDAFREKRRERIRGEQRKRCDTYAQGADRESLDLVRRAIDERDPATVEEMLYDLKRGRPLHQWRAGNRDDFSGFFPTFVEAVHQQSAQLTRAAVDAALQQRRDLGPLRLAPLPPEQLTTSKKLWDAWCNARQYIMARSRNPLPLWQHLTRLIETLNFSDVAINQRSAVQDDHVYSATWTGRPPATNEWFLPPDFGSKAAGKYVLLVLPPDQDPLPLLDRQGRIKVDDRPTFVVVFQQLSVDQRRRFSLRARQRKQRVILIDETLVLDLLQAPTDWPERMFRHTLPFGYVQPYSDDPGDTPEEMFFGRAAELDRILSQTSDGCLVYGGRQLGKSALLRKAEREFNRDRPRQLAIYEEIKAFGGAAPSDQLWPRLGLRLKDAISLHVQPHTADAFCRAVEEWLQKSPERRLLLLLDECDHFLADEAQRGFMHLGRLKRLMEDTGRRFKVVFAGLHSVSQMARLPNSPLVHLGTPICVGPLQDEERREAWRLVAEPMRAAGYLFEDPGITQDIVARLNAYPSLIQVFCKELVESGINLLTRDTARRDAGPCWTLGTADVFESDAARQADKKIADRFQWTLNLDPRFEVIARSMALNRLQSKDGDTSALVEGLSVSQIQEVSQPYWPPGIAQLDTQALSDFAEEMAGLGILVRLGSADGRYDLRSARIAQLLGGREALEQRLRALKALEPEPGYDPSTFRSLVDANGTLIRSPWTDAQANRLLARPQGRLRFAVTRFAEPEISVQALEGLARRQVGFSSPNAVVRVIRLGSTREIAGAMQSRGTQLDVLVLDGTEKVDTSALDWVRRELPGRQNPLNVIVVVNLKDMDSVVPAFDIDHEHDVQLEQVWDLSMVRRWLQQEDAAVSIEGARRLHQASGGIPALLTPGLAEYKLAAGEQEASVEAALNAWIASIRLMRDHVGLPESMWQPFLDTAILVGDDPPPLLEVWETVKGEAWAQGLEAFDTIVRHLERLSLIQRLPLRDGATVIDYLELTQLGHALAASGLR